MRRKKVGGKRRGRRVRNEVIYKRKENKGERMRGEREERCGERERC